MRKLTQKIFNGNFNIKNYNIYRCKSYIHGANDSYKAETEITNILLHHVIELVKIMQINKTTLENQGLYICFDIFYFILYFFKFILLKSNHLQKNEIFFIAEQRIDQMQLELLQGHQTNKKVW